MVGLEKLKPPIPPVCCGWPVAVAIGVEVGCPNNDDDCCCCGVPIILAVWPPKIFPPNVVDDCCGEANVVPKALAEVVAVGC